MTSVERIEAALLDVADLFARDPAFAPIFTRLEAELAEARARQVSTDDARSRALALLSGQRATGARSSAACSRLAP